jgi:hypothetical protein
MIRTIVHVTLAGFLLAGVASCKKKEGDTSGASAGASTAAKKGDNPPPAPNSGIPECEAYFKAMDKFVTCDHVQPQAAKDAYKKANDQMRVDIAGAKDKAVALDQCKKAMDDLVAGAKDRGCPLE